MCTFQNIIWGDCVKNRFKKFLGFLNANYFCIFAVVALLLPDLLLRYLVWPKVYDELFATMVPAAFNLVWIFLILYFSLVFLPKNWGRAIFLTIGGIFIVFSFSQYVYFQIFEQFFRLSSIGLAGGRRLFWLCHWIYWRTSDFLHGSFNSVPGHHRNQVETPR